MLCASQRSHLLAKSTTQMRKHSDSVLDCIDQSQTFFDSCSVSLASKSDSDAANFTSEVKAASEVLRDADGLGEARLFL